MGRTTRVKAAGKGCQGKGCWHSCQCENKRRPPKWKHTEVFHSKLGIARVTAMTCTDSKAGREVGKFHNEEKGGLKVWLDGCCCHREAGGGPANKKWVMLLIGLGGGVIFNFILINLELEAGATPCLFTISIVLPFPKCHIVGIKSCIAFRLTSLSI